MDPFRKNTDLNSIKVSSSTVHTASSSPTTNTLSTSYPTTTNPTYPPSSETEEEQIPTLPPPPAYHTIIDPNMPIPHTTNPYDPLAEEEERMLDPSQESSDDDTDTPDITINAATQIRGHGNIISIAQMDSMRIANLISSVLTPSPTPSISSTTTEGGGGDTATQPLTPTSPPATRQHTSTTRVRGVKRWGSINITVNCGATIIGDRNIVGPGLGDIARQMQIAQRNQAVLLAQQQQQVQKMQQQQHAAAAASPGMLFPGRMGDGAVGVGVAGVATPPMSRSCSLGSEGGQGMGVGGRKRRVEEDGQGGVGKRRC